MAIGSPSISLRPLPTIPSKSSYMPAVDSITPLICSLHFAHSRHAEWPSAASGPKLDPSLAKRLPLYAARVFPSSTWDGSQKYLTVKERPRQVCDPAHLLATKSTAWDFAPLTASRNGRAAAGAATRPSSVARVVTLGPYIARLELLSARTSAPSNVTPR